MLTYFRMSRTDTDGSGSIVITSLNGAEQLTLYFKFGANP